MLQGKCSKCEVRWDWSTDRPLVRSNARCPCCGGPLQQTTSALTKWPSILTTRQAIRGRSSWNAFCNGSCKREAKTQAAFKNAGL